MNQLELGDRQLSSSMADLVCGEFVLDGLNHHDRVHRLYALVKTYELVRDLGELEHTSDWDWRIEVEMDNGQIIPTPQPNDLDPYDWSDEIRLDYETVPGDYLAGFTRWANLTLVVFPVTSEYEPHELSLVIDHIHAIRIEEL